ncbi:MAG: CBS domain-containing protein [Candidatus Thorarchaeota archaeon]|nr:CBS domain-containing protein [Candidatus Thorarchaeota archaeon]
MSMEKFPSHIEDIANKIISIEGRATVYQAAERMLVNKIGCIIITENEVPVGIVTKSDLLSRVIIADKDPKTTEIRSIMSTPLITIPKEKPILDAIREIRSKKISRLVVTDKGKPIGLVSETDLIKAVQYASLSSFKSLLKP